MPDREIILVNLEIPPSSNNRLLWRGKKAVLAPQYRAWKEYAVKEIHKTFEGWGVGYMPSKADYRVLMVIGWPDRRRRDIDGPIKPVLDAVTESHVAWDDDSQVVDMAVKVACRACEEPGITLGLEALNERVKEDK